MANTKTRARRGSVGLGVDSTGGPTVDPTENVKDLSEALSQRQDDLRNLNNKYLNARIQTIDVKIKSLGKASLVETKHVVKILALQMERLDKIRQVDILNASVAAERIAEAVRTLATQTATNQETNRSLVASTSQGLASQLSSLFAESNKRLSALELSYSEGRGKTSVADPAMERIAKLVESMATAQAQERGKAAVTDPQVAELISEMKAVRLAGAASGGKSAGASQQWAIIATAIAMLAGLLLIYSRLPSATPASTQPPIIYVQPPIGAIPQPTIPTPTQPVK